MILHWRLQQARNAVRGKYELLTQGYTSMETWNVDTWLCEALGTRLKVQAENLHGWPGVGIYENKFEMWQQDMHKAADALLTYGAKDDLWERPDLSLQDTLAMEKKIIQDAKDALHWCADWLPTLWD